ncbi:MAG: acyl-CoA thioesterase [Pyrinomonadaceae bacterium]|nr:acyl-CoA thioesterase [Pyrinomonadaceae bacterium]
MITETKLRVRYAETDKMGIVHHSNYYVWFELGRSDLCRERGFSYLEMEDVEKARLVVAESQCRYKSPAFYEDELIVRTALGDLRSRSVLFSYEVYRPSTDTMIATGETKHIVTDPGGRIRTMPRKYRSLLTENE